MLTILAIVVLGLLAALLIAAAGKPAVLHVERSIFINAAPEAIYPLVVDFHRWAMWSPYENIDASLQKTFGGAPSGVGAVYAWSGNAKAGVGRMEITDGEAPSRITIQLDFEKPFKAHNVVVFSLMPQHGAATQVTWAMSGPAPFISRLMQVFLDMDRLVGKDFAKGLAQLKTVAEQAAR